MPALSGRDLLEGLPSVDELRTWETSATHAKAEMDLEVLLALQNFIAAAYRMRRRLEAVAMGRDVEQQVFISGGGQ